MEYTAVMQYIIIIITRRDKISENKKETHNRSLEYFACRLKIFSFYIILFMTVFSEKVHKIYQSNNIIVATHIYLHILTHFEKYVAPLSRNEFFTFLIAQIRLNYIISIMLF